MNNYKKFYLYTKGVNGWSDVSLIVRHANVAVTG